MSKAQYMKQLGICTVTWKGVWTKFRYLGSFNNFIIIQKMNNEVRVVNERDIGFIGVG